MNDSAAAKDTHKPRPLVDLAVSIIIPSVILMKFSSEQDLGATWALIVALAFPLAWGAFELIRYRKFNFIALLGLVSVLLTGGIGLLELDPKWLAVKEAAVPAVIGLAVLVSTFTPYPLVRTLLFNPKILNTAGIQQRLDDSGNSELFNIRLMNANYFLVGTFVFSSIMNYFLATWIVVSPAGSSAFNEELGRLTLLSYPAIAIPSMLMMMAIFWYLWRSINGLTGLGLEEILVSKPD
ncbi:MAG: intracellular septation protein A [Parasphingorhabdus sp.]|jgi:intracellular septation protein A